jgi:hypothetical protein
MTTVAELVISAEPDAWRAVGFSVDDHGLLRLGGINIRLIGGEDGLAAWVLADAPDRAVDVIDGLLTSHGAAPAAAETDHANGVSSIDHVVVYTPDLERTCMAIEAATGAPLRRVREAGSLRQGFHRLGELIVEVVTFPQIAQERATFWGLALNVDDIDALYDRCGDAAMSAPKNAVQPGRRIASFRESAALGLPVAVMTPHQRPLKTL